MWDKYGQTFNVVMLSGFQEKEVQTEVQKEEEEVDWVRNCNGKLSTISALECFNCSHEYNEPL